MLGERLAPNSAAPNPKDDEGLAARPDVEYGYASCSFFDDLTMASVAVARVGRGIRDNTVGLRVGKVDIRDVSNGSSVSGGKLAINSTH